MYRVHQPQPPGCLWAEVRYYQRTVTDTYAKAGYAKLYRATNPTTAASMLNDHVLLPFYEKQGIVIRRAVTDRDTEYCGTPQSSNTGAIWRWRTSTTPGLSPQSKSTRERFSKPILTEFYQMALRKKISYSIQKS